MHAVPTEDAPFCFFFRPVFPYLRELHWFASGFQSTPFVRLIYEDGGEERLDAAQMDVGLDKLNCILHRPGTLPELASYLCNDWIDLIGLRCSEDHAGHTARRLAAACRTARPVWGGDEFNQVVAAEAEVAFFCMDGFWWELYVREESLLDLVVQPLRKVAGVDLRPSDLRNRRALFGDPVNE